MTPTQAQALALEPTAMLRTTAGYGLMVVYYVRYRDSEGWCSCTPWNTDTPEEAWAVALSVFQNKLWERALTL